MKVLFINSAFREDSRTKILAEKVLKEYKDDVVKEIDLGNFDSRPLDKTSLVTYNNSVASKNFADKMFEYAKDFVQYDEIIIAAPYYNLSIPAILHDYLELVCTQGLSFDITNEGKYISLCNAKKLTFIMTAGGPIPEFNHAFTYIKDLCEAFWNINKLRYIKAENLDVIGTDIENELEKAYLTSK